MSNINKRLNELSPHIIGIRLTKGIGVIDTIFKEGWELPSSETVGYEVVPNTKDTYMLYPQTEDVEIDEMLDYVAYVIKLNVEREKKIELLQVKINELKHIFSRQSLAKCKNLKFTFKESLESTMDYDDEIKLPIITEYKNNTTKNDEEKNIVTEEDLDDVPIADVPENDNEIEEFNKQAKVGPEKFDLPTKDDLKKKPELTTFNEPKVVCKCDPNNPNEVCPACVDY